MATYYLDFENGNDANNGTTFANRWKSLTSGATAARIAPGDTVRIMGSPAPTSLGQTAVWTSQALQVAKTVQAAANATPISITCNSHGFSTGDTVVISAITSNTNANGTWEITVTGANTFTLDGSAGNGTFSGAGSACLRNNTRVMLATAVTENIASTGPGRAAWTAADAVNVTTAFDTTNFKEHNQADSIAIGAGFGTGLAAYWPTGTLNLSGYQQVSFWIRQTSGTVGLAGAVDLRLCSDTAGVTAVNTISIPNLVATGRWMLATVDLGTNLGNSIQSIALYVNTDNGAQTFLLSNIIACKASSAADSLTLTSLIGKNTTGETFWGIQSINGRRVMLDGDTNATPTSTNVRGYYGTSETVTTWKRETIKLGPAASSITALQTIQDSGTDGSPITFSGGWDRTDMSTQNLETWLDGQNGHGYLISCGFAYVNFDKFAFTRGNRFELNSQGSVCNIVACNNCSATGVGALRHGAGINVSITLGHAVANLGSGLSSDGPNVQLSITGGCLSNSAAGILINATGRANCNNKQVANNGTVAVTVNQIAYLKNLVSTDNLSGGIRISPSLPAYAKDCVLNESTETSYVSTPATEGVYSHNHDQIADNHKIFLNGALISAATDQRNTASGISWKIQPTSTNRSSSWPVVLPLAKVACVPNKLVTVKAWMRRDNSGLTMRLVCKGDQIAGVANDVVSSMTAAANTWEQLTITFTPTVQGVVEVIAEAWGGSTFTGWVDDMTISQAV